MTCDKFPEGSRRWQICRGESGLSLEKTNAYRANWGLPPLDSVSEGDPVAPVVHTGDAPVRIKRNAVSAKERKPVPRQGKSVVPVEGPGTELKLIFEEAGVPPCARCYERMKEMNRRGVAGCEATFSDLIEDMLPDARVWVAAEHPWAHALFKGKVEDAGIRFRLGGYLRRAIDAAKAKEFKASLYASGQTSRTAPTTRAPRESDQHIDFIFPAIRTSFREDPTLQRCMESLRDAGFQKPLVFSEPNAGIAADRVWATQLGPFRAFVEMANHMVAAHPDSWLLLCEDDVVFKEGLADYLRGFKASKDQCFSLYIAGTQVPFLKTDGWVVAQGDMYGSLAYLVHSSAMERILRSATFREWPFRERVDKVFCLGAKEAGVEMLFHRKALADHIGETSTLVASRRLTRQRKALNFSKKRHQSPLVTVITPTGGRPVQFRRCERWMASQRYTGQIQWIVVDDGADPTPLQDTHVRRLVLRETPLPQHSLCRNLRTALKYVEGEILLVMEDDDFYHPDYVSTMVGCLQNADLVGEVGAKYYWINSSRWKHWVDHSHVSLCRTGMTGAAIPQFREAIQEDHPSVDLRLWKSFQGSRYTWRTSTFSPSLCIGIKGGEGRPSSSYLSRAGERDRNGMFEKWTGMSLSSFLG